MESRHLVPNHVQLGENAGGGREHFLRGFELMGDAPGPMATVPLSAGPQFPFLFN